jgi:hypothetical protein
MNTQKMAGYVLYAIGIIGGVEGATRALLDKDLAIATSVVSLAVIVAGAYLIEK